MFFVSVHETAAVPCQKLMEVYPGITINMNVNVHFQDIVNHIQTWVGQASLGRK